MKNVLIGVGALIAALVGAALLAPSFVDWNAFRPQLVALAKEASGRDLAIDGDLDLALLPAPALSAKGVRLASVPGASEPDTLRVEELEARVALLPLLSGEIQVRSVRLNRPVLVLEELADGRVSWAFGPESDSDAQPRSDEPASEDDGGFALSLDDVEVRDGTVVYRSARSDAVERVEGLSFSASAGSLRGPFAAEGKFQRAGLPIAFELSLGALRDNRPAPARLSVALEGRGAKAEFAGSVAGARLAGKLKAQADDLGKALQDSDPLLARPLILEATVDASPEAAAANDLVVRFGEAQATGAVSFDLGEAPRFDATLHATSVDLDALLAAPRSGQPAQRGTGAAAPGDAAAGGFALAPNLSGALIASIDGVVYRGAVIRQAQVNVELADGKVVVKRLAALLPGGSDATLTGALAAAEGRPWFEGRLELASDNLRGLLGWLQLEPPGVPRERLNAASLTTALRITPDLAEFPNVKLRIDDATLTGGAAYRLQRRPSFAVDFTVDRLNLDAYLAEPDASPTRAGAATAAPKEASTSSGLAALNDFDANVKLRAGQLVYNRVALRNALLDATLAGGRLTLRQARVQDAAGATLVASGVASDFAARPTYKADVKLTAENLSGLAELAGFANANAAKLGATELAAQLEGGLDALAFRIDGKLAGGTLAAEGRASALQAGPDFDVRLSAQHGNLVSLVRNFGLDWRPANDLGGLALELSAKGGAQAIDVPALKVSVGPASLEGAGRVALDGPRPRLSAKLHAGDIVIDRFLSAEKQRTAAPVRQGASGAPARATAPRWSREPLDLSALQSLDADVELEARSLAFRDYPFQEAQVALSLSEGTLRVAKLTGKLFGGAATLEGALASAPRPALTLKAELEGADLRQALATAAGLDNVSGPLRFAGTFRAEGRSEWDLVNSLAGEARFEVGEGALRGVDLGGLSRRLGELNGPAAFLDLAARSFSGGETKIRSAAGTWQVANGVATTRDSRALLEAAEATLTGTVQLPAWRMDLTSGIALTEHPAAPPIGVSLSGPLDAPRRDLKTKEMEKYLAARIGSELLRKGLGDKVKELGPLEDLLGGRRQQPQTGAPAQPQPQQAPPAQKAIESLLEGLLKR